MLNFMSMVFIRINDTSFELSVFWLSDTESLINELRFSDPISLSFKTRLTSVTCFAGTLRKDPFSRRIAKSTFEMTIFQLQPLLK